MGAKKKSSRKKPSTSTTEKILLATALIQLIQAVINLIDELTG